MNRRQFLTLGVVGAAAVWSGCAGPVPAPRLGRIMTVRGALAPDQLGWTLAHEHAMVHFAPPNEVVRRSYNRAEIVETVLPYVLEAKALGIQAIVDATPAYLGRDPLVLRALSERSGVHVLTNTGYYGARSDEHVPDHAYTDTIDELAGRWIAEWRDGIDGTGIRPGFVKIGVDSGPLTEIDGKLVEAAAVTHLATGLTIAAHTGPAGPAFEQIDVLEELGVHPSAWIWVHAQAEGDLSAHVAAARRGAWVSFDGVSESSVERDVERVMNMHRHGAIDRVLLSQDAGWYSIGEEGGGSFRGYTSLLTHLVPALRVAGLDEEYIDQLLHVNPAEAYRIRIRRLS